MATFARFEEIEAWQLARELARRVFELTRRGKLSRELYLRDQLRRACLSIMSNIAEGFERDGDREFRQFLPIAKGSCGEVMSQLYVARDQGFVTENEFQAFEDLNRRTGAALGGLIRYLGASTLAGRKYRRSDPRPETRDSKPSP